MRLCSQMNRVSFPCLCHVGSRSGSRSQRLVRDNQRKSSLRFEPVNVHLTSFESIKYVMGSTDLSHGCFAAYASPGNPRLLFYLFFIFYLRLFVRSDRPCRRTVYTRPHHTENDSLEAFIHAAVLMMQIRRSHVPLKKHPCCQVDSTGQTMSLVEFYGD
jgi:hypothetical protein